MSKRITITIDEQTELELNEIKRFTHINTTSQIMRMLIIEKSLMLRRKKHE